MSNKLLSIIIPTYNMEAYLEKCLNSLIINNETMNDMEVIVVIDGGTDRSSEIAHEYHNQYPSVFKVIDKSNGNYGSCINRGIQEANGKYIKILDADDSFNPITLNDTVKLIADIDVDLILNDYSIVNEYGDITDTKQFNLPTNTILTSEYLANIGAEMAMHAVMYKTDNLRKIKYMQSEGISYTDQEWIFQPMTAVKSIYYIKESLYQYLVGREGQTMNSSALYKNIHHNLQVMNNMIKVFNSPPKESGILKYLEGRLYGYAEYVYSNYLYNTNLTDITQLIQFDKEVKTSCPTLYSHLNSLHAGKLPFIRLWRLIYYKKDFGFNNFFRYRSYNPFK